MLREVREAIEARLGPPKNFLYFIRAEAVGRIKIGISDNPERRIKGLRNASPVPLELIGSMPGDPEDEYALHRQFAAHRCHGEWFEAVPELVEFIRANALPMEQARKAQRRLGAKAWKYAYQLWLETEELTHRGETRTILQWIRRERVPLRTFKERLESWNWQAWSAIFTPVIRKPKPDPKLKITLGDWRREPVSRLLPRRKPSEW